MASLVESGMKNLNFGDADSVGFFQMRVGIWNQGAVRRLPRQARAAGQVVPGQRRDRSRTQRVAAGKPIDDPNQLRRVDRRRRAPGRAVPRPLPDQARRGPGPAHAAAPAAAPAAAAAAVGGRGARCPRRRRRRARSAPRRCAIAKTQHGVREVGGANRGPQVEEYLAAAKVAPGNPWCASFITWSLEKAGHKMPGGGWAAVQTWVRNAEQGNNGLQIVSAEDARPGDIVAYDWGGQNDFGADGHIGFLDSTVKDGKFTALEGNNADAVNSVAAQHRAARTSSSSASRATLRAGAARRPSGRGAPSRRRRRAAAPSRADRPDAVRRRGQHGRPAERRGARAAEQQEHRARRRRASPTSRPAGSTRACRRADQAQPGAQDHGLVHVLGPLEVHRGRLGLQPLLRPRRGHRARSTARSSAPAARWRARSRASSRR